MRPDIRELLNGALHSGETRCFDKKTPLTVVAIAGIVLGVIVLLSIGAVIFAVVRYRRNRKFQRTYVQNAQANANANNVVPPAYPPMAHVGQPHTQHMQPHNQALEQHNQAGNLVQNQAAYQSNAYTTPTAGIGGVSGYTV
ncbi:hypothetical protein B0H15DRAFT_795991 [Mycena belliarum]|uniref:Uncharacterized protein n=1 Tax=Mycena belliarum TaxID=1033014 RepID=A0AAD6Y1B4_9AGAR|nr:hypothetical protein B0H15DRAFT_795991 [Mycena belliae]